MEGVVQLRKPRPHQRLTLNTRPSTTGRLNRAKPWPLLSCDGFQPQKQCCRWGCHGSAAAEVVVVLLLVLVLVMVMMSLPLLLLFLF